MLLPRDCAPASHGIEFGQRFGSRSRTVEIEMSFGQDRRIALGLVGIGKIARDQHIPALARNEKFDLVATASRSGAAIDTVARFASVEEMIDATPSLSAVSLCTPPQGRYAIASAVIEAGLHLMLEKPPGATVAEVEDLAKRALANQVTMFASWHSREAAAVQPAQSWLADKSIHAVRVAWREDVRVWHPGQEWIWQPGGLGVFDPGINALSILTKILPGSIILESAALFFPSNRCCPIKSELRFSYNGSPCIEAVFDFLQTGRQTWDIEVETDHGTLLLSNGGAQIHIDGRPVPCLPQNEYSRLYARFAELITRREADVDVAPLRHVADAFLLGQRMEVDLFSY
jgi:D-galactose 1-dehydrogenase